MTRNDPESSLGASPKLPYNLKAGILAAGRGRRLRSDTGPLKPLVKVGDKTLIEYVLNSLADAGASEVFVIINEDSLAVREHVMAGQWPFALRWIVETTPTSMHSFLRLVETMAMDGDKGPFLLSTVDTIAGPQGFARFISEAQRDKGSAVTLALTSPRSDDNPLYVRLTRGSSRIAAIGPAAAPSEYATAGVYAVRSVILREAEGARRDGLDALRTFLIRLLDRHYELAGVPIADSIDVDCPADIGAAADLLRSVSA